MVFFNYLKYAPIPKEMQENIVKNLTHANKINRLIKYKWKEWEKNPFKKKDN
jgi:hypothetical protein